MPTSRELLLEADRLGVQRLDAEVLLAHALERDRAWLFAHADDAVDANCAATSAALLARRAKGEPVAYLTGRRGFWSLDLEVTPATLIPRPETELLVTQALACICADGNATVADLGTGSGAIALAIASERPQAQVVATDVSAAALAVAQRNATRLAISNVSLVRGHWCAALAAARFDVIVSNPPYIADDDPHLLAGDLPSEPRLALASGADGMDAIGSIAAAASARLAEDGWLLLEHGWQQGAAVRALLREHGFSLIETVRDLERRERVTRGRASAA